MSNCPILVYPPLTLLIFQVPSMPSIPSNPMQPLHIASFRYQSLLARKAERESPKETPWPSKGLYTWSYVSLCPAYSNSIVKRREITWENKQDAETHAADTQLQLVHISLFCSLSRQDAAPHATPRGIMLLLLNTHFSISRFLLK